MVRRERKRWVERGEEIRMIEAKIGVPMGWFRVPGVVSVKQKTRGERERVKGRGALSEPVQGRWIGPVFNWAGSGQF